MVRIAPFRGLRYDPAVVGDDLAAVTAPPYDAIDAQLQEQLYRAHPHNVVRLERSRSDSVGPSTAGPPPYREAAESYRAWIRDGVLRPDPARRLYVSQQDVVIDGRPHRQRGLIVALGLGPWGSEVLPHERVFRGPVEDRKALLRALPANISPVYVLASTWPDAVRSVLDVVTRTAPEQQAACDDGVTHRLWSIAAADTHAAVARALADEVVVMADGHHRYTTALEHHEDPDAPPGSDAVMALVAAEDDGPLVRPMHRQVTRLPPDWRATLHDRGIACRPIAGGLPAALEVAATGAHGFGVLTRDGAFAVGGHDLRTLVPASTPAPLADLDVTALQHLLVDILGIPERIESLYYTPDAHAAARAVAEGSADALWTVRAVGLDQVRRAARAGLRLPPKSTSFGPKPRTGLVLRPLEVPRPDARPPGGASTA